MNWFEVFGVVAWTALALAMVLAVGMIWPGVAQP